MDQTPLFIFLYICHLSFPSIPLCLLSIPGTTVMYMGGEDLSTRNRDMYFIPDYHNRHYQEGKEARHETWKPGFWLTYCFSGRWQWKYRILVLIRWYPTLGSMAGDVDYSLLPRGTWAMTRKILLLHRCFVVEYAARKQEHSTFPFCEGTYRSNSHSFFIQELFQTLGESISTC